jgi:hypothetical protein
MRQKRREACCKSRLLLMMLMLMMLLLMMLMLMVIVVVAVVVVVLLLLLVLLLLKPLELLPKRADKRTQALLRVHSRRRACGRTTLRAPRCVAAAAVTRSVAVRVLLRSFAAAAAVGLRVRLDVVAPARRRGGSLGTVRGGCVSVGGEEVVRAAAQQLQCF